MRIITRSSNARPNMCHVIENGAACDRESSARGVCEKHYGWLLKEGLLDQYANKPRGTRYGYQPGNLKSYRIKTPSAEQPGICRLIVNESPCQRPSQRRGLCVACYASIWQREKKTKDIRLRDFALENQTSDAALPSIQRRRQVATGECVVRFNGEACAEPAAVRGVCIQHHALLLKQYPAILERISDPVVRSTIYTVRSHPRPDKCRLQVDGIGCSRKVWSRGLCFRHYRALQARPDFTSFLAPEPTYEVVPNDLGMCRLAINQVQCTKVATHRGLCRGHYKRMSARGPGELDRFAEPIQPTVLSAKSAIEAVDGLCSVIENGVGCRAHVAGRGLCRRHIRLAQRQGIYESLAAPRMPSKVTDNMPRAGGPKRKELPPLYLDKNVLFDYVDHMFFRERCDASSIEIVKLAMEGHAPCFVSTDAVKGVYSRIRYRMRKPMEEGGRNFTIDEAEKFTKSAMKPFFLAPASSWRFVALSAAHFARALHADTLLSVEDAWEWASYQEARVAGNGPKVFVTRDKGFPEGVHPADVIERLKSGM